MLIVSFIGYIYKNRASLIKKRSTYFLLIEQNEDTGAIKLVY